MEGGTMTDEDLMRRAIALSREAALRPQCEPFGAVVVRDGEIVGEGFNRSAERLDPTSHGETEAIRDACRRLGTLDLTGCEVFTSTEPCALCVATMKLTGIRRVVYAASLDDSSATLGRPKERVTVLRAEAGQAIGQASIPASRLLRAEAVAVLAEAKAMGKA
jgi:tRNA(Arg) A34 adenosine deaminase TadA